MITYHVVAGPLPAAGAAAHRVRETILALRAAGDPAPLIGVGDGLLIPGIELIASPRKGPAGLVAGGAAGGLLPDRSAAGSPAAVHAHGWESARPARDLAREVGVPLVVDVIASPPPGKGEGAFAGADRITSPSASVVRALGASATGRAHHLPGSIDPSDLPASPPAPYRIPPGKPLLLVFAPLAGEDPDPLLRAFEILLGRDADLHLVIMGHPIGAGFMQAVSAHGIVPRVTFGGLPSLAQAARLVEQARGALFALSDPGLVEPYAALLVAAGAPILAADGPDARAFFEGAAEYAAGRDGRQLGEAAVAAFGSEVAAPRAARVAGRFTRAAFAERLRALDSGIDRAGSTG